MIRFSTLGSPDLRAGDGRPLLSVLAQPKRVAFLAYLAIGEPETFHRRDTLLGIFWPELDQERARHALRQALYVLRRGLGADVLASRGDEEIAVDTDLLWCDVPAFESAAAEDRLEEALELYRGPLLEGFFLSDAPAFEKWLDGERARLRRLAGETAGRLAEREAAEGHLRAAIDRAREAVDHCPEDEAQLRRLLRLLDGAGDRAGAIRTYEAFSERLDRDLGVEPSPETQRLVEEIRTRETARPRARGEDTPQPASVTSTPGQRPTAVAEGGKDETGTARRAVPAGAARAARAEEGRPPTLGELPRPSRRYLAAALALAVAAISWGAWTLWSGDGSEGARAAPTASEGLNPARVAVLYFEDRSEGGDHGYLAGGLTEGVISELSQIEQLDVVSILGVKPFRDREASLDSLVRALGAGSLVEGSVQRSGDRVRVGIQLIDAATGTQIEREVLERPWGELFRLQDELVVQVVDFLRRRLGTELRQRARRAETESVEAWTLVHRAEALREDAEALAGADDAAAADRLLERADSLLERAEALDREWIEPIRLRGWLAAARASVPGRTVEAHDPEWYRLGLAHVERALGRAPEDPRALALRGILRFRLSRTVGTADPETLRRGAEADLRAAVERDPSLARAWAELSELTRLEDRRVEAKWAAERALAADAFLSDADDIIRGLFQISLDLEQFDEAIRWCEHGGQRFPEDRTFVACRLFLMALDGGPRPDPERAWGLLGELLELSPAALQDRSRIHGTLWVAAALARTAADARRPALADSARAVCARVREGMPPELAPWADYYEANVRLLLGEREAAYRLLESFLESFPNRRTSLATDWAFRPLWEDARFRALVANPGEAPRDGEAELR